VTVFASGAATDVGQVRAHNEDNFVVADTVFVVADGMGGHNGGEVASQIAVDRLAGIGLVSSIDDLVRGVQEANADILERAREQPEFRGMGTTVVMLADIERAGSHRLGVANVGDSRLYRVADSGLHQHTEDHSLVEALVRDGRLTPAEAAAHPQRNIVTRALGIDDKVLVDAWELVPVVGDRYALCSDGLFGEIDDGEIHEVLQATSSPQDAADELVRRAREAGGRDNITVVVVDVIEADPSEERSDDRVAGIHKALFGNVLGDAGPTTPDPRRDETPSGFVPPAMTWRVGLFTAAVLAVVIGVLVVVSAIGRSGYTVAEGDNGTVVILKGRDGGFLFFGQTLEVESDIDVDELPPVAIAAVRDGQRFDALETAELYLENLQDSNDSSGS
jgi:protein phosphatase